ncbi:hypothetical protein [Luteibacter aegosomatissinici]|uniref:hypothetical protein n=1 Tax=Luteibacter aegosomatissinici TaxID=2911539 RepID=UPI001FF8A613|nr:hypothetical protein [Luteibacter aegosomatissinici]UPG92500.1 hypothetical protein L2Y97_11525 [Luteibacter aegosomatissinici]
MARLLMIGLRLVAGSDDAALVDLVRSALVIARSKGYLSEFPARLARTEAGTLLLLAELVSVRTVDAMDEDPELQDVIMQISALAESFPLHSLVEFNANRVTFETLGA